MSLHPTLPLVGRVSFVVRQPTVRTEPDGGMVLRNYSNRVSVMVVDPTVMSKSKCSNV